MDNHRAARALWAVAFLAAVYLPIGIYSWYAMADTTVMALCDLLGLIALSLLVCVVALTARIRPLTRTIKLVQIVWTHKFLGIVTTVFVLVHVGFVLVDDPARVRLFNPSTGTPASRAATLATLALFALPAINWVRRRWPEVWRWLHIFLAAAALVLAGLHVYWLNHLIRIPAMRAWFVIAALLVLAALADRWVVKPLRYLRASYRVVDVRPESADTYTIVLTPAGSRHSRRRMRATPAFRSGQYAWLRLHAVPTATERPFTICSSAQNRAGFEFTVRNVGGFTDQLTRLAPGRRIWLDGPHGAFHVPADSSGTVAIVAGVGITPAMSILRTLADRGDTKPHRLMVGARHEADFLFRQEIHQLSTRLNLAVVEVLSRPTPSWVGAAGRIRAELLDQFLPARPLRGQLDYFVCGPKDMVQTVVADLGRLGVPAARINFEYLAGPPRVSKPPVRSIASDPSQPHEAVRVRRPGPSTNPVGFRVIDTGERPRTGAHRRSAATGPGSGAFRAVPAAGTQRPHRGD